MNAQIEGRKRSNAGPARNSAVIQITQLVSSRNLALRRNDRATVEDLNRQIVALGGDPSTGDLASTGSPVRASPARAGSDATNGGVGARSGDWEEKIQRINENNRRRTKEAMVAAHQAALVRKKAEEAIVRAKQYVSSCAGGFSGVSEGHGLKRDREAANGPAEEETAAAVVVPVVAAPKKGETTQAAVARTIDIGMDDF